MKYLPALLLLFLLTGCCRIAGITDLQDYSPTRVPENALYRFRLERSDVTKLSGVLALKSDEKGIWGGLLDATGVPLLKLLTAPDGGYTLEYCAAPVCDTKLPEIVGKLIDYIYFTPANAACPWYSVSRVCENVANGQKSKWHKLGPFRSWEIAYLEENENMNMEVAMYFSTVQIHLQQIPTKATK